MSPQAYFSSVGRRVRCTVCRTWQRTDPQMHQAGWRLREMQCSTEGCLGRLRSRPWWARLEAAQAECIEHAGAAESAREKSLRVNVPRGLNCREARTSKGRCE